jgi:ferritin-like protein
MKDYHEPHEELGPLVRDQHRALVSLKEELEAVDWYHQRAALCGDDELKRILEHNRDEEIEHAAMSLEWLRRNSTAWVAHLQIYLFTTGPIVGAPNARCTLRASLSLKFGSLRG